MKVGCIKAVVGDSIKIGLVVCMKSGFGILYRYVNNHIASRAFKLLTV
jgi:hypothetical protein